VIFAQNGAEAVELIQCEPFDLVLMDVQMPVMDGVEATRRIRNLDGSVRDIPIFALTANVMASEREKYLAVGMTDCLLKPIDWKRLRSSIAGVPANCSVQMAALDHQVLDQFRSLEDDNPGFIAQLTRLFLDGSPVMIANIEASLIAGETVAASGHAHSLKGSSANMGAKHMASICASIEQQAREGDLRLAQTSFKALTGEFARVSYALQQARS
jgi:CheY-like chemotaxis protein